MSLDLMSLVFRMEDLASTDKLVLLALADAAHDDGYTHIPVKRRRTGELDRQGRKKLDLLIKTGLSERALQMSIKRLVEAQYLHRNEKAGKGVEYLVTPASDAGRSKCAPQQMRKTPAPDAGKPLVTVSKALVECPDDFYPTVKDGSKTAERMTGWSPQFLAEQVEKFIAYHQAKGTKSRNWSLNWTTWALNNFDGKAGGQNSERTSNGSGNVLFDVAKRRIARRAGEALAGNP